MLPGFPLIELLVVIAMIALLVTWLPPAAPKSSWATAAGCVKSSIVTNTCSALGTKSDGEVVFADAF